MLIEEIKNIKSSEKDLKQFGITMGIALIVIAVILIISKSFYYPYFAITGLVFIVFSYAFTIILKPVQKVWMSLALIMGWFSTRIILSSLYFLVITPIGLLGRISGKKFLDTRIDKKRTSYWSYRAKKNYSPADSEKQF